MQATTVHVGVVNLNVCRLGRRRGVGTGVSAIFAHQDETHMAADRAKNKHMHGWLAGWLVDARGIRLGEAKL
jgi:hypothetical protein